MGTNELSQFINCEQFNFIKHFHIPVYYQTVINFQQSKSQTPPKYPLSLSKDGLGYFGGVRDEALCSNQQIMPPTQQTQTHQHKGSINVTQQTDTTNFHMTSREPLH